MTSEPNYGDDPRTVEDLMKNLRGIQLYMVRMEMTTPVPSPFEYLAPHLREHILWLEALEKAGVLFLAGAHAAEGEWDGGGTAVIRAASLQAAREISDTEPFHRMGLRTNTVHGWTLNEGTIRLTVSLFTGELGIN